MDFPNARAALEVWLQGQDDRSRAWDRVECNDDVWAAERADNEALAKVQEAFFEDTKPINSLDHCRLIHITDVMRLTGWKGPQNPSSRA